MRIPYKRIGVVVGFSLLFALLIVNATVTRRQISLQTGAEFWLSHTRQVLFELKQTEVLLLDAESEKRGYLYTGDTEYLAPFNRAVAQIQPEIDAIARLTADNPHQQTTIPLLRNQVSGKIDEMEQVIALYQSGKLNAAKALVLADTDQHTMDRIDATIAGMENEETRLESLRVAAYERAIQRTIASIYLANLFAVAGLVLLAYYILREIRLRERLQARDELFGVTLTSLGDAVIATDELGKVTFLNPVAEKLTGNKLNVATGKDIAQVFPIVNELTGEPVLNPVSRVLEHGAVVGLANRTVLQRGDGFAVPIDDSAAPIRNESGELIGVVLVFRDVTERRRAEETSRRLASIVESSDDAIIGKDMNGIVTSWNQGARAIFGYSEEEMIGRPISVLAPPDRKNEMSELLARIRRGEHVDHFHSVRCTKDGRALQVSITVSPVRNANGQIVGASKILRDITSQVEAQKEIALEREQLQVTLRSIGDAVVATDTEGRVSFLNPVAERLTGWSSDEAAGRPLAEVMRIVNEQSRRTVENPVTRVLREGKVVGMANHTVLIARDGNELAIDDSAAPIRDDRGQLTGVVLVFRDVTNERKAQEAMRRTERLATASRLSAAMAHEINNPLQAVAGLVYLSRTTPGVPNAVVQQLYLAEQELDRVAHIAQQTLGFYRESKVSESVDMPALVESALTLYTNKLRSKDIRIERHFGDCPKAQAPSGELKQVVSNLVANAADAVQRQGTIAITLGCTKQASHTMLHLLVEDDGLGIPPEYKSHLFEPFFTTKREVGTGLGLWLTKEIVERHGGRIEIVPRADGGAGAAFSILLPIASNPPGVAAGSGNVNAFQPSGPNGRIDNAMEK